MDIQRKAFGASFKTVDDEKGIVEAIVSVFGNVDRGNEVIQAGCFAGSLQKKLPFFVWCHNWDQPLGKTLEAKELLPGDPMLPEQLASFGGLWVKGQFNLDTQRGREAYSDLKFGSINEFSIGFTVTKESYDKKSGVRYLEQGELFEWSPVLVGMNPATAVISVKSAETKGEFLGDGVEQAMTMSAVSRLNDKLFSAVYSQLMYSTAPVEERLTQLEGACNEFRDMLLKCVGALLADAELAESAAYDMCYYGLVEPETKDESPVSLHVGRTVEKSSEALLAGARSYIQRIKGIQALRLKEGRTISQATAERLKPHAENMRAAADDIDGLIKDALMAYSKDKPEHIDTEESSAQAVLQLRAAAIQRETEIFRSQVGL